MAADAKIAPGKNGLADGNVISEITGDLAVSRRSIFSLVASVIMGIGFVGSFSDDASAYYRRGVGAYRGGVYRGGVYRGVRPGVAVGVGLGAAAVGAAIMACSLCLDVAREMPRLG
jgi:hypothetical protein